MLTLLLLIMATLLAVATVLPVSKRREWWIRAMDFPRLQIALGALLWLLLWLSFFPPSEPIPAIAAVVVVAVLVYQIFWIFPNTEMHAQEVARYESVYDGPAPTITLLSSNVLMTNRDSTRLLEQIELTQPDIVITLESDQWWQDRLDTLNQYPHRIACPLYNLYGMHVYSRLPLKNPTIEFLVENDKPSMSACVQVTENTELALHVVHPAPPAPGENEKSTERDVELVMLARTLADREERIIVAGDLNDVAWSATTRLFRQISGLLDPRVGRGLFNTFNAKHWFARWPLDHIFVSSHFKVVNIQRLPAIGSDHFPLLVKLAITDNGRQQSFSNQEAVDEEHRDSILSSEAARQADAPTVQSHQIN